ncbi:hypothetical protein [Kitasatospora sp. NPDC088134]|uniref:hypothetical protein n=1 Tax=Kitasatospora sp. NPDC088134 TaxID=3364071 RepID=UPI003805486B
MTTPSDRPLSACLDTFWHGEFTLHPPTAPPDPPSPALDTLTPHPLGPTLAPAYRDLTA